MRHLYIICLLTFSVNILGAQDLTNFFHDSDDFFGKYVSNGLVNYKALDQDPYYLDQLLDQVSNVSLDELEGNTYKAFAINAYNLMVIKQLVDFYPTTSPMKIDGFFDNVIITIGGKKFSLNSFEKGDLFVKDADPRLHFALVCGAMGCPRLLSNAYWPERLDQQLDNKVREAMLNKALVNWDSRTQKLRLSKIFQWYEKDFGGKKGARAFVNNNLDQPIDPKYKIVYLPYSWKINEDLMAGPVQIVKNVPSEVMETTNEKVEEITEDVESEIEEVVETTKEIENTPQEVIEPTYTEEIVETVTEEVEMNTIEPVEEDFVGGSDSESDEFIRYSASTLYERGEFEAKMFTGIYAQKNKDGFDDFNSRSTYLNMFVQTLFGVNSRINVGVDAWIRSSIDQDDIDESFLKTLKFKNEDVPTTLLSESGDTVRWSPGGGAKSFTSSAGLSHLAPKIKVTPFKNYGEFSIQETFFIPVNDKLTNSYISVTDIFYSKTVRTNDQLFGQLSYWVDYDKETTGDKYNVQQFLKGFYSIFPSDKTTVYATSTLGMVLTNNNRGESGFSFLEAGFGAKYLITDRFEIELLYTKFMNFDDSNRANNFNLGFRYSLQD